MSASETASKRGLSSRRVGILCNEGCRDGAQRAGATWIIPKEAEKPSDARIKSGKHIKLKKKVNWNDWSEWNFQVFRKGEYWSERSTRRYSKQHLGDILLLTNTFGGTIILGIGKHKNSIYRHKLAHFLVALDWNSLIFYKTEYSALNWTARPRKWNTRVAQIE